MFEFVAIITSNTKDSIKHLNFSSEFFLVCKKRRKLITIKTHKLGISYPKFKAHTQMFKGKILHENLIFNSNKMTFELTYNLPNDQQTNVQSPCLE